MKKALPLIFSISITAGTICLGYVKLKAHSVKKLLESWLHESKKFNKTLDVPYLTKEVEKLNLLDIHLLKSYTRKASQNAPVADLKSALEKIQKRKILQRVDLKSLENSIFPL